MVFYFSDIVLSGVESVYYTNTAVNVTCSSNLTVQSIIWRSTPVVEYTTKSETHRSTLTVSSISPGLHSTVFTCEVTILLPQGTLIQRARNFLIIIGDISKIMLMFYYM